MKARYDLAVIGADGAVGTALLELIAERRFPAGEISALALDPEEGAAVEFAGHALDLDDAAAFDYGQVQLAFLADADPRLAAQAERAADAGCVVVDASGTEWPDTEIPRVVAELNPQALAGFNARGIVSAPDRLAVPLLLALSPLQRLAGLHRVTVTVIVPASDGGRVALEDLARETTSLLNARPYERRHFAQQIAFNVHGQTGSVDGAGRTERERRVADDLRMLLGRPALEVGLTMVQGAVFYGYALSVEVQLEQTVEPEALIETLRAAPGLEIVDSPEAADCPSPVTDATADLGVRMARLRPGAGPGTLAFWLTADNIRRAAALNAVANAEVLVRDYL